MSAFKKYFVESITERYADFSGRARRSEYWFFVLFFILSIIALSIVLGIFTSLLNLGPAFSIGILVLYALALIIPSIAVAVRRLHDMGQSGWLYLISLIPLGGFVLLVMYCMDSKPETNKWGPNPKAPQSDSISDHLV